jgi:DNA-binding phage protein
VKINIKSILVFPFIFTFLAAAPINTHNNLFTGRQAASAEFTTVLHQLAVNVGLDGIPLMNFSPHSDYDRLCLAPLQDRLIIGHPTFMNNVNTVLARHPIPPDTSVSKRKELQRQLAHELQPYMKTVTSALHASMTEVQPLFTQKAQSVENALGGTSLSLEHIYALQVELMELRKLAIYSPEFMKTVSNLENKLLHPRPMEALTEIPYDHRPSQAAIHQPLYALRKPTRVPGHKPTQYTAVEILPTHTPHVISPKKSIQYVPLTNTLRRILDPLSLYLGTEAIRKQFWQRSNQLTQNEIDDVTPIILNEITWRGRDGDGRQVTITEEMMSNGVRDALAIGGRVLANFLKTTGARTIYTWEDPIGAIMALSRATRAAGVNSESLLATLTQSGVSSISVEQLGDETKGLLGLLLSAQSTAGINAQHLRKILGATRALNDPHGKLMEYAPIIAQELDGMQPDIALHLASTIQSINDHVNKNNIRSILRGMAMALSNCGQQKQFLHTVLSAAEDQINEDNANI